MTSAIRQKKTARNPPLFSVWPGMRYRAGPAPLRTTEAGDWKWVFNLQCSYSRGGYKSIELSFPVDAIPKPFSIDMQDRLLVFCPFPGFSRPAHRCRQSFRPRSVKSKERDEPPFIRILPDCPGVDKQKTKKQRWISVSLRNQPEIRPVRLLRSCIFSSNRAVLAFWAMRTTLSFASTSKCNRNAKPGQEAHVRFRDGSHRRCCRRAKI